MIISQENLCQEHQLLRLVGGAELRRQPPTQCDYAVGETLAHLAAKQWMIDGLRERGYSAELEVSLDYNRADILVAGQNQSRPLAIELQHTSISAEEIEHRAERYAQSGIAQLWIPFLTKGSLQAAQSHETVLVIERYSARPLPKTGSVS